MKLKVNKNEFLYFIGLFLLCLINWEFFSKVIEFSDLFKRLLLITITFCFFMNILMSKYTSKELIMTAIFSLILLYSGIKMNSFYIFINTFAILASKQISTHKIVKFLFYYNLTFLLLHVVLRIGGVNINTNDYYTYLNGISRETLNLRHPNYLAAMLFWMLSSFIFINKNKTKTFKIITTTLMTIITYQLTYSRTTILLYAVLLGFVVIENVKFSNFLEKNLKWLIIVFVGIEIYLSYHYFSLTDGIGQIVQTVNTLLSQRLYLNFLAVNTYPLTILGNEIAELSNHIIVIDSFYVSCLVQYGIITMVLSLFAYMKYNKKDNYYEFLFLSIVFIAALTERYIIFITMAFPLIFLRNILFEHKNKIKTGEK